jgi:outer membrane murein-binding lipoprotein Lpp
MRFLLSLVILSLLVLSGCRDEQAVETAQPEIENLNKQLEVKKNELMEINKKATELVSENQQLKEELKRDYEDLFFLICRESNSQCPGELKYFDPRKIKLGDSVLGMKVMGISVGTGDPGSYSVSFAETVEMSGKYIVDESDPMGPYLWLDTTTINGQKYSIHLGVGGNHAELEKALKGSKQGDIKLKLKDLTLQNLPHKPAYNSATFVGMI